MTLASTAKVLHKTEEQAEYRAKAAEVSSAFNQRFYSSETHVYDRSSQTDYAMPLALGLAPEEDRDFILQKLVADIRAHNNHVTAGDIGFHYVVKALMDNGRADVLYDMLSRSDAPSYGYQLSRGATSLTEAWDANPLSSQNHFMLGHAEEWFYRGLAGIDFDMSRPLAERIIIRPSPVGDLSSAGASYDSVLGRISSNWTRSQGVFTLAVDIPPNASAMIKFPADRAFPDNATGVIFKGTNDGVSIYEVESCHYVLRSRRPSTPNLGCLFSILIIDFRVHLGPLKARSHHGHRDIPLNKEDRAKPEFTTEADRKRDILLHAPVLHVEAETR
jgi:hypothetical protein